LLGLLVGLLAGWLQLAGWLAGWFTIYFITYVKRAIGTIEKHKIQDILMYTCINTYLDFVFQLCHNVKMCPHCQSIS